MVLTNNTKTKTLKNKVNIQNKQNRNLIYNSQYNFVKFKDVGEFKELSLDSMYKKLNNFYKKFAKLKYVSPQTKIYENPKEKVLGNVGDLFNKPSQIYKDKYNKEIAQIKKAYTKFNYKKLILTDDYHYESEKEKEQTRKKSDKKEPPKKPQKLM